MNRFPRPLRSPYALGAIAGLSLVGTLAGCSATTTDATTNPGSTSSDSSSSDTSTGSSADSGTATGDGTYADGDYSASGSYSSPGGTETIQVELTLADGVVTDVTVTGEASDNQALRYQTEFSDGIAAVAVGENIDDLKVSRVAGSSLTSGGFNDAVESIKADALA
ncbi:MAG: hypothetical protein JWQ43_3938 [Glaciihabitans sp.]|nr:hypothetical protein [Glaciihabitans sp.]